MKKIAVWMSAAFLMASLSACTPSSISSAESTQAVPEGAVASEPESQMSLKDKPTVTYTIPADAPTGVDGGPGMMETTAVDDSYYPAEKQSAAETAAEDGLVCALYTVDDTGVYQTMSNVAEKSAQALIAAMTENGILAPDTEVISFTEEDGAAKLVLNELKPVYEKASEEEALACVVNTLTENLGLDSIEVTAGEKDYGVQSYTDAYNRT